MVPEKRDSKKTEENIDREDKLGVARLCKFCLSRYKRIDSDYCGPICEETHLEKRRKKKPSRVNNDKCLKCREPVEGTWLCDSCRKSNQSQSDDYAIGGRVFWSRGGIGAQN